MAELDTTEIDGITHKLRSSDQLHITVQLPFYLLTFHLRGRLQLFGAGLSGETLLIGAVDGIADIEEILRHKK